MNIRTHIATDGLTTMIEGNFGLPVELTAPDGIEIKLNENGFTLKGQILYDREALDPESGDLKTVQEIMVTLRKTALSRIPLAGETWKVAIPLDPALPTVLTTHLTNSDKAPIDGGRYGTYHATSQGHCTWYEFALEIFRLSDLQPELAPQSTIESGAVARRPPYSVLENSQLKRHGLDRMPLWQDGLTEYLQLRQDTAKEG